MISIKWCDKEDLIGYSVSGIRTAKQLIIKIFYLYSGVKHPRCGLFGRASIIIILTDLTLLNRFQCQLVVNLY